MVDEVCDQQSGVSVLSGDLVEVPKVDTEPKGAVFFLANRTGAPPGELDA